VSKTEDHLVERLFFFVPHCHFTSNNWAALLFLPALVSAATVNSTVTCGSASTSSSGSYVECSSGLDYATASGSIATLNDAVNLAASSYSSYAFGSSFPSALQVGASADTSISDTVISSGAARSGYAEVVFTNVSINQSNLSSTSADLSISLDGDSIYNCHVAGGGFSTCPTTTILAPVQLGVPFTLIVDDVSYSAAGSFSGGISAQIALSLLEANGVTASSVREVSATPEPTVWALMIVGLCVMGSRIKAQMRRL
jgi:hypothetical protein